jgi:hypothetical protein
MRLESHKDPPVSTTDPWATTGGSGHGTDPVGDGPEDRRALQFRSPGQCYKALFADLSDGKVECLKRLYGNDFLVDESIWRGRAPGRPFGLEGKGRPLEFRLLHVIEFATDGNIKRENVWVDFASVARQLPQS